MSPRKGKDEDTPTASGSTGGQRVARSIYLDSELLDRMRAAVTYLSAYVPDANVRSLSDLVEPGAWQTVQQLERDFHDGKPFPPVSHMSTGRPRHQ